MDTQITVAVNTARMSESLAVSWFEERLRQGRSKVVDFRTLSPLWPERLREKLVLLEAEVRHPKSATSPQHVLDLIQHWSFEPTTTKVLLDSFTPEQWSMFQDVLDSNTKTSAVVALLRVPHPLVEAYKSSNRARIAVVASCMVFINEPDYTINPKYQGLGGLFSNDSRMPVGQLSLPQPLIYFANCFPQYRETWQRLACEMANQNPMGMKKRFPGLINSEVKTTTAQKVVNALTSLMLGKVVDAEALLRVRNSLDPNMDYETLVQSQLNNTEVFELPATFDENMFCTDFSI
jgi:hypothetical protein